MKISKPKIKKHEEAMEYLKSPRNLKSHEVYFFLEHFQESLLTDIVSTGTFFTPVGLASDFAIECSDVTIIDLCAGVGSLLNCLYFGSSDREQITAVERNYRFVEIGEKLFPEVNWICGDVFDVQGRYGQVISNPPFGKIKSATEFKGKYTGGDFEYKVIEKAAELSPNGVFIIPQISTPYRYSGQPSYKEVIEGKCKKFIDQTGFKFGFNCGIDTVGAGWKNTQVITEIVHIDFPYNETEVIPEPPESTKKIQLEFDFN